MKVINLFAGPGAGKCLQKGVEVLLYDGSIKKVENLIQTDVLMGNDSTPRQILTLHNGFGKLYKIQPIKGDSFTVNENHILSLVISGTDRYKNKIVNISIKDYLISSKRFKEKAKLYRTAINFIKKDITIDPYFLGLWLGDGLSDGPRISTERSEIIEYLSNFCLEYPNLALKQHSYKKETKCQTYALSTGNTGGKIKNLLLNEMRDLNLINNKHIPENYKCNTREIRLQVLAGLIDSDGHKNNNGCYEIATKFIKLREDILFLARSLGYSAYYSVKIAFNKEYYRINISGIQDELPVILQYKKSEKRQQIKNILRTGLSVIPVEDGEFFGFELDGNHLFCLGDFTVTHNSTTAAGLFHFMKLKNYKVELITEYAKELTYEKRHNVLADQLYVLAKQNRRLERLKGQVDYAITDSPLLLGLIYMDQNYSIRFPELVISLFHSYNNINFYINRVKDYQTYGRNQTHAEALIKDQEIYALLREKNITHAVVSGDANAPHNILKMLESKLV